MVATNGVSAVICGCVSLGLVASQVLLKSTLASSQLMTITGGFMSSLLFVFLLTGVSNLEMAVFGKHFQSRLPEVVVCLVTACFTASMVHRVSITTCLIFSLIALYHLHRISVREYQSVPASTGASALNQSYSKKRR